jgi:hypothetical protein
MDDRDAAASDDERLLDGPEASPGAGAAAAAEAALCSPAAASAAASPGGHRAPLVEPSANESLLDSIGRLKEQQAALRAERKKVAKDLRNAERRKNRLKRKARQLTDADLLQVMQMRTAKPTPSAKAPKAAATDPPKVGDGAADAARARAEP